MRSLVHPAPTVLELSGLGRWHWDVTTGTVGSDTLADAILGHPPNALDGYPHDRSLDAFLARVHPEDLTVLMAAFTTARYEGSLLVEEFRVVDALHLPDPRRATPTPGVRRVRIRGALARGAVHHPDRMLGIVIDTTTLPALPDASEPPLRWGPDGLLFVDPDWRVSHVDETAAQLLATTPGRLLHSVLWDVLPGAPDSPFHTNCRWAMRHQRPVSFGTRLDARSGWLDVRVFPRGDGLALRLSGADGEQAGDRTPDLMVSELERSLTRGRQLLELNRALAPSMTPAEVADQVTRHLRRFLGVAVAAVAVRDADRLRYLSVDPPSGDPHPGNDAVGPAGLAHREVMLSTPCPQVAAQRGRRAIYHERIEAPSPHGPGVGLGAGARADAHLPLLTDEGAVLGTLSLFWDTPQGMGEQDRGFLDTLAEHCTQALQRATLFQQKQTVAEALQSAVLPDTVPLLPGWELAVRYVPATRGIEVGGDWYDAFHLPDGRLAVAVGDATGHGLPAARVMGSLRNALRAYALLGEGPGAVLGRLDQLLASLAPEAMATVVYLEIDPVSGRGVWSSAGHPPPLWWSRDCTRLDDTVDIDPPLGCLECLPATERPLHLRDGEGMLLYTDGLVERRGESISRGLRRLERFARRYTSPVAAGLDAPAHRSPCLAASTRPAPDVRSWWDGAPAPDALPEICACATCSTRVAWYADPPVASTDPCPARSFDQTVTRVVDELLGQEGSGDDVCVVALHRGPWGLAPAPGAGPRPTRLSRTLPPRPQAAAAARTLARDALCAWGRTGAVDAVTLVVSEMVTNAVQHARTTLQLDLECERDLVRVSVTDSNQEWPRHNHPSPDTEHGRGVHLVDLLATRWGVRSLPQGKRVWAELPAAHPVVPTGPAPD